MSAERVKPLRRGFNIGRVRAETKPLAIEFEGQILHVDYYPRAMKLKDVLDQPDPNDAPAMVQFMADVLARRLASWDLEDDSGPIGTDSDSILDLPSDFIKAVLEALNAANLPGEQTGSN